ncbi:MAG: hypothetical protein V1911_03845 [Candidatus Micrarchaeota archaeon]
MIEHSEQIELFEKIGGELRKETQAYAVGGTALMFHGLKERTKDIDLVFTDRNARRRTAEVLQKKLWYANALRSIKTIVTDYEEMKNKPMRFECHGRPNFDLFLACLGQFKFSKSMQERAVQRHDFGNFHLYIAAPEDILLLKSITERITDREDAAAIIKGLKLDKKTLFAEAKSQGAGRLLSEFLAQVKKEFGSSL